MSFLYNPLSRIKSSLKEITVPMIGQTFLQSKLGTNVNVLCKSSFEETSENYLAWLENAATFKQSPKKLSM